MVETISDEAKQEWFDWANSPEHAPVQKLAVRFPPWELFRMTDTEQIVGVVSFYEDGTLKVYIDPEYNSPLDFRTGFEVFGVNPDMLEPWSPPPNG